MATNFWESSHWWVEFHMIRLYLTLETSNRWLLDESTLRQARAVDLQYADAKELALLGIFFANVIAKLGKRLNLRQQVIATATVYFRRFYIKSSYCETDPFFVAAACCYVAAKAEETPIYLKTVVQDARSIFSSYGVKNFPTDNSKLAEMEFYLLEDLEFHLIVFHPYRSLATLCGRLGVIDLAEAGEVGAEPDEERYWGTGEGMMNFDDGCVQMAWFVINDSYRGDLCLLYPPYLIAVASLYLSVLLHGNTRAKLAVTYEDPAASVSRRTRSSTANGTSNTQHVSERERLLDFLAGLNVSLETISRICQHMLSLYALWDTLYDGTDADESRKREKKLPGTATGLIPRGDRRSVYSEKDLVEKLHQMRQRREADLAHPTDGRPTAANKLLERV
ncbi:RNA polymerase II holoenzyme cyclin-like subunit [Tulasnella sp. 403]|nr:RNA polymerase II holoenzyme cyclin-like subunit [Tulasnella sp. 403]